MANNGTEKLIRAREALVAGLRAEIGDGRVLDAIARVPREAFVPAPFQHSAYENIPLPIGYGQTISQPLIVALMTQALQLTGNEKVLEIGTGSGYQTAILAQLARHVVSVERIGPLAERAREVLRQLGYTNVEVHAGGEGLGWPAGAPYDAILVTAAAPEIPRELLDQLGPGGRLVIPVGGRDLQELVRIVKTPEGARRHNLGPCRFVPLLGKGAWPAQAAS
jgi:protein-L-isoaspartate(D-aspartate) O-methyltransferase